MIVGLLIGNLLLAALALLPLLRHEQWVVRIFDFPRLQIVFLLLFLLVIELFLLDLARPLSWVVLMIAVLTLAYEAWWILPYSPLFPVEVAKAQYSDPSCRLRLMIANVLMSNRKADELLQLVRQNDPDVLVTLESNRWWENKLDSLEADYPHTVKCPLENRYGMHVYSRLPLRQAHIEYLLEDDKPSIHTALRLPCGEDIRCHFLHPAPPSPTESADSSQRDAELIVVARSVAESELPVIVSGDLNDVAWSRTTVLFRKLSGLLDPRIGRGMFNTFHAQHWFLRWPLDHLFHSNHFALLSMKRQGGFGSDHFALVTELAFVQAAASRRPRASRDEQVWADYKHKKEGVSKEDVPQPESHGRRRPPPAECRMAHFAPMEKLVYSQPFANSLSRMRIPSHQPLEEADSDFSVRRPATTERRQPPLRIWRTGEKPPRRTNPSR